MGKREERKEKRRRGDEEDGGVVGGGGDLGDGKVKQENHDYAEQQIWRGGEGEEADSYTFDWSGMRRFRDENRLDFRGHAIPLF